MRYVMDSNTIFLLSVLIPRVFFSFLFSLPLVALDLTFILLLIIFLSHVLPLSFLPTFLLPSSIYYRYASLLYYFVCLFVISIVILCSCSSLSTSTFFMPSFLLSFSSYYRYAPFLFLYQPFVLSIIFLCYCSSLSIPRFWYPFPVIIALLLLFLPLPSLCSFDRNSVLVPQFLFMPFL